MSYTPRCTWPATDPLMIEYHDQEWGVPLHDDQKWFEFIVLDAFQAGLSWKTILHKRGNFRKALDGFDPVLISKYQEDKVQELMQDAGIIRNQLKIRSTITNALSFLEIQKEYGSFDRYIWGFTDRKVIQNSWKSMQEVPAKTPLSDEISKSLKKRGFKFVGSTIVYAFLQSAGVVNDHVCECFRHSELGSKR
ncbi:MAG: DNA-3-methyladenine glycosylase I [Bacteroidota bacterium]|nr:DNA-3-methyladenine glycosylase I [Bacteroidota bacterium]